MQTVEPIDLVELLRERRKFLTTVNGNSAEFYRSLARQVEVRFLAAIGVGINTPSPADRARILASLETILRNGVRQTLKRSEIDLLDVLRVALNDLAAYHQAAAGAETFPASPRKIVETFFAMEERINSGQILRVMEPYRSQWAGLFDDRYRKVMREVQRRLTRAAITGDTVQQVAEGLRGPLGSLELNGHQDPEVWANAFVRTTQQQLYNDFSIAASKEAGIGLFVNIGVGDERQSRECYEASQEAAKTLVEWDEWKASNGKGGRPGDRHVFNCRCSAAGVPDRFADDDWSQPNEYWERRIRRENGEDTTPPESGTAPAPAPAEPEILTAERFLEIQSQKVDPLEAMKAQVNESTSGFTGTIISMRDMDGFSDLEPKQKTILMNIVFGRTSPAPETFGLTADSKIYMRAMAIAKKHAADEAFAKKYFRLRKKRTDADRTDAALDLQALLKGNNRSNLNHDNILATDVIIEKFQLNKAELRRLKDSKAWLNDVSEIPEFENFRVQALHYSKRRSHARRNPSGKVTDASIFMGRGAKRRVWIHELGHTIEFSSDSIRSAVTKWRGLRTKGEELQSLRELTGIDYRLSEKAKPDKFYRPYVGKFYPDGDTEVVAMGMELLYSDPVKLAKEDPGMFDLMVRILKNTKIEFGPNGEVL